MGPDHQHKAVGSAVSVHGEVTIYRAAEVATTLFAAVRAHIAGVNLDMSEVTEIDTAGLQVVLMARRMVEADGRRFEVVQPSECVMDVLDLCNVPYRSDPRTGSQQQAAL